MKVLFLNLLSSTLAFAPGAQRRSTIVFMSGIDEVNEPKNEGTTVTDELFFPMSFQEMVNQASGAMADAKDKGISRQGKHSFECRISFFSGISLYIFSVLRILLPRSAENDQLLQYYEDDAKDGMGDTVLVPPDETWQGGIMQLYRAASFASQEILRRYSRNAEGGVVPRLNEDRSVDESGVDGIGLFLAQGSSSKDDLSAFVQPTQETVDAIESISGQAGSRLVALVNPQWRITDDALDKASRSEGVFGSFASFLGGKGGSLRRLDSIGFESVYILEGYVCRGGNIRLMKRFDSDWVVFAENDAGTEYIRVGTSPTRPTYQDVDSFLLEKGISLKYARDIGLAPKL